MAIIERKQLTGTTEQINAYAGHQGQLAFDKTTKHLHVLSGTAGASTKLANISDIPDVSSFATTKELDKYLPLSGGDLKGVLTFSSLATIDANTLSVYKGLEVRSSTTWGGGASIYLRSNEATGAREAGSWGISSKDSNKVEHVLQGIEGNLYYDGAKVECNVSTSTFRLPTGGSAVERRFSSGLMIIVGEVSLTQGASETVTFKTPFASYDYGVGVANNTANSMRITSAQKTSITFRSLDSSSSVNFYFIIMGPWK